MWLSENQRLGMKECSMKAYLLESCGDSFNLISVPLFIISIIGAPIISYFHGWSFMFIISIPLLLFFIAAIMRGMSKSILKDKGFRFDYESDTVWIKDKKLNK
jgi:MFS family permease